MHDKATVHVTVLDAYESSRRIVEQALRAHPAIVVRRTDQVDEPCDVVLVEPQRLGPSHQMVLGDVVRTWSPVIVRWSWAPDDHRLPISYDGEVLKHHPVDSVAALVLAIARDPEPVRAAFPGDGAFGDGVVLTRREEQVLHLISAGLTNTEIGEVAELSINSVKTYVRTAYRKIGVDHRSQAVRWARQHLEPRDA
ncbi:helix-turn-helix transcriptional regulator [Nocardioides acrostichi]|uniref:Response regulator transcription factor n=1 Tax=Nocardioides acrostichi TaxID=2784339 RepID=A0A930YB98_9ACTN|nr:LuxR C-terminal-related transcriptional regulator [Nocardioides acrostichi]MBF4160269.1 response regulator transcription factor [Nocardioides acrostichi]